MDEEELELEGAGEVEAAPPVPWDALAADDAIQIPAHQEETRAAVEVGRSELYPCTGRAIFNSFPKVDVLVADGANMTSPEEVTIRIIEGLHQANQHGEPVIFQRGGVLVAIYYNEDCQPTLRALDEVRIRRIVDHAIRFVRIVYPPNGGGPVERQADVTSEVLKKVLGAPELPFPKISEISTVPGMRPDGSVHQTPGFDRASGRYLHARTEDIRKVSDEPDEIEVDEAKKLVESVLAGYPFVDDGSKANAIGMLLTPYVRCLHNRLVPLHAVSAKTKGTGKSKLCEVLLAGRGSDLPEGYEIPDNTEELRKTIQTAVLAGNDTILLDNLDAPLKSSGLCAQLTLPTVKFRILGGHTEVSIPNQFLFMVTGNNIQVLGDMGRRVQLISMDAGRPDPWNREFELELPDWVIENRGDFVWALLSLVRAWITAGKPEPLEGCGFGKGDTYGRWARVVGGIIGYAGWGVFGANRDAVLNCDPDPGEWATFLEEVLSLVGEGVWWYASDLADRIVKVAIVQYRGDPLDNKTHGLLLALPSSLGKPTDGSLNRRLGKQLSERVGVPFPDCDYLIERKDGSKHRQLYRVRKL